VILLTKYVVEIALKYLTDRLALAVLMASAICLLLILAPGELGIWMKMHAIWFFMSRLFCLCYLPSKYVLDKVSEIASNNKRHERLIHLTRREKEILSPYVQNDFRTRGILNTDPVAKGLVHDGVLYNPGVVVDNNGYAAYNIQDWVRAYLKEYPQTLSGISIVPAAGDI